MENRKMKILAIDDNQDNLLILKALIKDIFPDASTLTASDGGKGFELAAAEDPDVILLDIVMPGMDGFEVCRKLRGDRKLRDIPVVFITALKGDKESRIRALECGADAFLAKPIDESELTAQIRAMMKIRGANVDKRNEKKRLTAQLEAQTRELKEIHTATLNLLEDLQKENEARKKSEDSLRESENRLRFALEGTNDGLWDVQVQTGDVYLSPRGCEILGYGASGLPDAIKKWSQLVHPDDLPATYARLQSHFDGHTPIFEVEQRLFTNTGEWKWILTRGKVVTRDAKGQPLRMTGTHTDITERKRTEEQILRNENHLKSLVSILQYRADTIQEFLDNALSEAIKLTESRIGYIYFYYEDRKQFVLNTWSKDVMKECSIANPLTCYELDRTGVWGESVRQRKVIIMNDFQSDHPLKKGYPEGHVPLTKFMTLPVFRDDRIVAVVGMANKANDYNDVDVLQLSLLMEAVWKCVEIKRGEDALHESEAMHRTLVESLPDIVMRFDQNGRHLFVSDNVSDFLDLRPQQFIGKTHRELGFPGELCSFYEKSISEVFDKGMPLETEFPFKGKNGLVICNLRLVPELDEKGAVRSVLSIIRDITEHRRAEENYKTLFNEMLDGFSLHEIICDGNRNPTDYRFISVNPAFERMTGLKAEEIVGRTVLEILPGTEKHWIETYGKVAITGEPAFFENYSGVMRKYFEVKAFRPIQNHFACIFTDITERKRAEEEKSKLEIQLRESQKMQAVGQLAGGISHDFNNLLSVINGYAQMLLKGGDFKASERTKIQEILRAGELASSLTRQLLVFSRRQPMEAKIIDLNAIVSGMNKMLRRIVNESIAISTVVEPELWRIKADPAQLEQVIMNLVVNGRDAMPDGGTLTIKTENVEVDDSNRATHHTDIKTGSYVVLSVTDTGCGMDDKVKEHIFEPFFTTKEIGKGTGLGLAIIYGIVKQSSAYIDVQSELGKGTTFRIYFPMADRATTTDEESKRLSPIPGGNETILLVEDEAIIRDLLHEFLKSVGYQVLSAGNASDALELAGRHKGEIHLMLTDIVMPGMNGFELAKKLRKSLPKTKLLFMSGYAKPTDTHGMIRLTNNLINKPISIHDLAIKLREILDE